MERRRSDGGAQTRRAASGPAGDSVMKQRAGSFGFVRVSRYAEALEQKKKAESRALRLEQQLEVLRGESRGWKGKADQAQEALKQAQVSAAEVRKQLERAEKRAENLETL